MALAWAACDQLVSDVDKGVEALGAAIMVNGGLIALDATPRLRSPSGQAILLGLKVVIVAAIFRTIIVDTTLESVAVLGMIVVIRMALSFSLEVEIDGTWPRNLWRAKAQNGSPAPEAPKSPVSDAYFTWLRTKCTGLVGETRLATAFCPGRALCPHQHPRGSSLRP